VALRQNLLIEAGETDLWYVTETAAASSGAPLFNDSWQVVGVHRVGVPARGARGDILTVDGERWNEQCDETRVVWRAGVATRTSHILHCLATAAGEHPLVQQVLREGDVDAAEAIVIPLGSGPVIAATTIAAPLTGPAPRAERESPAERATAQASAPTTSRVPIRSGNGRESPAPTAEQHHGGNGHDAREAITVTVPLRITVRSGSEGGRQPVVGVDLS
jgi:endonuclease G